MTISSFPSKPTLGQVREAYNEGAMKPLTPLHLAERAHVPLADALSVEAGGVVSEQVARSVLDAFAGLTGQRLFLSEICVHLTAEKKPTLGYLCNQHGVAPIRLAHASNHSMLDIWGMTRGSVPREVAVVLMAAFNALAQTDYTLADLRVTFTESEQGGR